MPDSEPNLNPSRGAIRAVLLNDWDPHNAARMAEASGAYDLYLDPLADLIRSGAGEEQIMEWLHERERETLCFPSLGKERLRRVARLLLRTMSSPDGSAEP